MKTPITLFFAGTLGFMFVASAPAQIITSGLVANYDAGVLTNGSSSWANSASGPGAWGSLGLNTGTATVGATTPSSYNAVNLLAGTQVFSLDSGDGFYNSYAGMTVLVATRLPTASGYFSQLAGTWEGNALYTGSVDNSVGVGKVQAGANPGTGTDGVDYVSPAFATPYSNDTQNKWTILAYTVSNNTSGTNNRLGLYQTDYVVGTPTTASWTQIGLSTDGTLTLQGGANSARFSVGGGLFWWGGVNSGITAEAEIASVLVYDRVLDSTELAQTTDSLYNQVYVVPEPSTALLVLAGMAGAFVWRRMLRRSSATPR